MFTYFHTYSPETWEGQIRRGLIRATAGIRFPHSYAVDEALKFNAHAAVGTPFHGMIRETKLPLYVDRLQGGIQFDEGYTIDVSLVDEYIRLLGDDFYGFQIHEWASNLMTDIRRFTDGCDCDWTEESIRRTVLQKFPYDYLFLEAQTAGEFAADGPISTADGMMAAVKRLYGRRLNQIGRLLPCDSYALAYKLELDAGTKRFMPEVGAQTPNANLQISYARGMAKAYGATFGVYYEPWGGSPFSSCSYHIEGKNEWNLTNETFPFHTCGGNGGSSRSLQKRVHLYGYLSGARFMSEEWGGCNTFYDWHDFELTPYGTVKKDFLDFVDTYPDVGEKLAPVAAVLPKDLPVLSDLRDDKFLSFPIEPDKREKMVSIRQKLLSIFSDTDTPMLGNEISTLPNCAIPDAVDVIHADAPTLDQYRYLVDLTCDPAFSRDRDNIVEIPQLKALLEETLPCTVRGGLHWLVTQKDDSYYVAIFNHGGVIRSVAEGERVLPEATVTATLELKQGRTLQPLEGSKRLSCDNVRYFITIPGGDWFFGRF